MRAFRNLWTPINNARLCERISFLRTTILNRFAGSRKKWVSITPRRVSPNKPQETNHTQNLKTYPTEILIDSDSEYIWSVWRNPYLEYQSRTTKNLSISSNQITLGGWWCAFQTKKAKVVHGGPRWSWESLQKCGEFCPGSSGQTKGNETNSSRLSKTFEMGIWGIANLLLRYSLACTGKRPKHSICCWCYLLTRAPVFMISL